MDTPRILVDNRLADGVVTATTTEIGYSAMHLTDWREYTYYRSGAGNTQYIAVNCGVAKAADSVALAVHNLASVGASVSVECSNDDFAADITVALPAEAVTSTGVFYRAFATQTKAAWRLKITGLSAPCYIAIAAVGVAVVFPEPLMSDYTPEIIAASSDMNVSEHGHPLGVMMGMVMARSRWSFDRIYDSWFGEYLKPLWDSHFSKGLPGVFVPTWQAQPDDVFLYRVMAESGFKAPLVKGGRRRLGLELLGTWINDDSAGAGGGGGGGDPEAGWQTFTHPNPAGYEWHLTLSAGNDGLDSSGTSILQVRSMSGLTFESQAGDVSESGGIYAIRTGPGGNIPLTTPDDVNVVGSKISAVSGFGPFSFEWRFAKYPAMDYVAGTPPGDTAWWHFWIFIDWLVEGGDYLQ